MSRRIMTLVLGLAVLFSSAAAADTVTLPNPLRTAQPGQWVLYRINTLFGMAEQRQTIVKIAGEGEARVFTIKSEMSVDDEHVDERIDSVSYEQALAEQENALEDAEQIDISDASIDFKDTKLNGVLVEFVQDEKKCRLYLSEDVPVVGMIRLEMEGMDEPAMELVDFGQN